LGTLGGLVIAWGLSFSFRAPDISSGIGGILAGMMIAFIIYAISRIININIWFLIIVGLIAVYRGSSLVAGLISTFLLCHKILPGWLYIIFGSLGLIGGIASGNFIVMRQFNLSTLKTYFSSTIIIFIPTILMIVTGMISLPFYRVACRGFREKNFEFWINFFQTLW
jgi:hypothetical protein